MSVGQTEDEQDYQGAIADYTKAIELNPNYADAYANRGIAKYNLNDMKGCCSDFRKAISLGSTKNVDWVEKNCK